MVDQTIEQIVPHLDKGDIIIEGGNSLYTDSERRAKALAERGILFIGTGVSGGEEGARHGPSIMPGGSPEAWPHVRDILRSIAAKAVDGSPCCDWVGKGGAGHYVKMVHNGIEYGDMQLIGEAYQMLKEGLGLGPDELADIFAQWNKGELNSYLIPSTSGQMRRSGSFPAAGHRNSAGRRLCQYRVMDRYRQCARSNWNRHRSPAANHPRPW